MSEILPTFQIPDHTLIRRIGQGSYGEVWLAINLMGTYRAVKIVRRDRFETSKPYEREFEGIRRYEPVSRTHPGLVDVLHVGRDEEAGYYYCVMELADDAGDGESQAWSPESYSPRTLRAELMERGRFQAGECAELGLTLAGALEHLHRHGLVHRDIKPANIIFVNGQPKVADIGLVAEAGQASSLEGTEGFSAPEGSGTQVADVFSLGKVLYEACTGKDRHRFPEPPTGLAEATDRERWASLNEVLLRACSFDPRQRHPSMAAFREDLLLVQAGGLMLKSRAVIRRWKRLAVAGAVTAIMGISLAATALLYVFYKEESQRRLEARLEIQRERAATAQQSAVYVRRLSDLTHDAASRRAEELFATDRAGEAISFLTQVLRENPSNQLAGQRLVSALSSRTIALPLAPPLRHAEDVTMARFAPNGQTVATASYDGTARLWDAKTGLPLGPPLQHGAAVLSVAFSQDGALLVTASDDHTARIWDTRTGSPIGSPFTHAAPVRDAEFNADGTRLATASEDNTGRIWEVATGRPIGGPLRHDGRVNIARFSPDGRKVLTASHDATARLWDAATGEPLRKLEHDPRIVYGRVLWAEFSPDGHSVVTASGNSTARIWNTDSGELAAPMLRHKSVVRMASFSPDGGRILTASWDGTARLWNARTGEPISEPLRHSDRVRSARFSANGLWVVTTSIDRSVRVWNGLTGAPWTEPFYHEHELHWAEFDPQGARVITASADDTARIWDVRVGSIRYFARWQTAASTIDLSPDGRLAACFDPLGMRLLDIVGEPRSVRTLPILGSANVRFSRDGKRVAGFAESGIGRIGDVQTGRLVGEVFRHERSIADADFSPDGTMLATASFDGTARVWSSTTGEPASPPLRHGREVWAVQFHRDGRRAVTASLDGTAQIWDAISGQAVLPPLRHAAQVLDAEFSPDGQWVVTASHDRTARLWDVATGKPLGDPLQHPHEVEQAHFDRTGSRLLTLCADKAARVWDVRTGRPISSPMRHLGKINHAEFSPDGLRVITASEDGTVWLWDAGTGQPLTDPLRRDIAALFARFNPAGNRVVILWRDGQLRLWDVPMPSGPVPRRLLELAESLSGEGKAGTEGSSTGSTWDYLLELKQQLNVSQFGSGSNLFVETKGPDVGYYDRWTSWFVADRRNRSMSPWRGITNDVIHDTGSALELANQLIVAHQMNPDHPDHHQAWYSLQGQVARNSASFHPKTLEGLAHLFHLAAERRPADRKTMWAAIRSWHVMQRPDAGLDWIRIRLAREPREINWHIAEGYMLTVLQRAGEARAAFAKSLELAQASGRSGAELRRTMLLRRGDLLRRLGRFAESNADYVSEWNITPRSSQAGASQVNLSGFYNRALDEEWFQPDVNGGYYMSSVESDQGWRNSGQLDFDLRGVVQLAGSTSVMEWKAFPERVGGIRIGGKFGRLHFVHAAYAADHLDLKIGSYIIHFTDGRQAEIPIVYGGNIWCLDSRQDSRPLKLKDQASRVWNTWPNPAGVEKRWTVMTWENPFPEVPIESLDFTSTMANAAPFLGAITGE